MAGRQLPCWGGAAWLGGSEQSVLAIRIALQVIHSFQWPGLCWAGWTGLLGNERFPFKLCVLSLTWPWRHWFISQQILFWYPPPHTHTHCLYLSYILCLSFQGRLTQIERSRLAIGTLILFSWKKKVKAPRESIRGQWWGLWKHHVEKQTNRDCGELSCALHVASTWTSVLVFFCMTRITI